MPDRISQEDLAYLQTTGIQFVQPNYRANAYIADVNRYIAEKIRDCRELFPLWLEWAYLKDMFIMPGGSKETSIKQERAKFTSNLQVYPFHSYINWNPADNGNIVHNDAKFLPLLYQAHGAQFKE